MFKRFIAWIRQAVTKMFGNKTIGYTGSAGVVSSKMATAIDFWLDIYRGECPWLHKDPHTLGLPAQIASEIARLVTLELEVNISTETERGEYIKAAVAPILAKLKPQVEYGCAGGGLMFRPFVDNGKIAVQFTKANCFVPTAFDSAGNIFCCDFAEQIVIGKDYFTRIERHFRRDGKYVIQNLAFKGYSADTIGSHCQLSDCPAWKDIEPEVEIDGLDAPLFSYFRIPLGNTIDLESPLGVSVFARAVDLIRDADEQYQRLMWEFKGGELAIDASDDAFAEDPRTHLPKLPAGKERLYRMNAMDDEHGGELMKAWAPTLRDASYLNGLDAILIKIEDQCGLSRGTLCNRYDSTPKTATELKMSRQRSYATVSDVQAALENALNGLIKAIDELVTLYDLAPVGEYTVSYKWDDSIIVDAEAERLRDQQEVSAQLMLPWEYRVKWYGESEAEAKTKLSIEETDDDILGFGTEPK